MDIAANFQSKTGTSAARFRQAVKAFPA